MNTVPEQVVPMGIYCYTPIKMVDGALKIQCCPYWQITEKGAYCKHLKLDSENGSVDNLIWDQVKECGINFGDD